MFYSSEKLKELYINFNKYPDDVYHKAMFLLYRRLWEEERKKLASKWSTNGRKNWWIIFRLKKNVYLF